MPGAKIPVLEIEKLTISRDGRGLYAYDDGDTFATHTWGTDNVLPKGSGAGAAWTVEVLPAASAIAWLKVTYVSSTTATETAGYIPVFNSTVL